MSEKYPSHLILDDVLEHLKRGRKDEAADALYDWMHEACEAEDYQTIDFVCYTFNQRAFSLSICRSLLVLTKKISAFLPCRPALFERIYNRFVSEYNEVYANKCVGHLE